MRWIFLTLLAANAAVFVWYWSESDREARLNKLNAGVGESREMPGARLVLVSELSEAQRAELAKAKPVTAPASQPVTETKALETKAADGKAAETKGPETKTADTKLPETSAAGTLPTTASAPAVAGVRCLMIGPLADRQKGDQLSQRLLAVGIAAEIREVSVENGVDYMVILPPAEDNKAVLRKLQELRGRNIDAQIIPSGDLANAISFGVFADKSNADKLVEQLKRIESTVMIKERPRMLKENWAILQEKEVSKLNPEVWAGLHGDFPVLDKRPYPCH